MTDTSTPLLGPDDYLAMLQRRCRQLEKYCEGPPFGPIPDPMLILNHIGTMHDVAMQLARSLLIPQQEQKSGEDKEAAPNGEAKAH